MHVHSERVVLYVCACVCVCERSKHMAGVHSDVWNTEILALSHSHISRYALHGFLFTLAPVVKVLRKPADCAELQG